MSVLISSRGMQESDSGNCEKHKDSRRAISRSAPIFSAASPSSASQRGHAIPSLKILEKYALALEIGIYQLFSRAGVGQPRQQFSRLPQGTVAKWICSPFSDN